MTLSDYADYEEFVKACRELHKDEEDPEFDLQDIELLPQDLADTLFHSNAYWELLEELERHDADMDAFEAYLELHYPDWEDDDPSDIVEEFIDKYIGQYDDDADFAEQTCEELGDLDNVPNWVRNHIDWDAVYYCELRYDYEEQDGYYFRNY